MTTPSAVPTRSERETVDVAVLRIVEDAIEECAVAEGFGAYRNSDWSVPIRAITARGVNRLRAALAGSGEREPHLVVVPFGDGRVHIVSGDLHDGTHYTALRAGEKHSVGADLTADYPHIKFKEGDVVLRFPTTESMAVLADHLRTRLARLAASPPARSEEGK